jgi:hypothetical protein
MLSRFVASIGATALLLTSIAAPADAKPKIVRDLCQNEGASGGGEGLNCPEGNILVRAKWGVFPVCEWRCCPPNGDGTYNCNNSTPPTRAGLAGRLGAVAAPRDLTADPNPSTTKPNQQVLPGKRAPIVGRGIESGEPEDFSRVSAEGARVIEESEPPRLESEK